MNTKVDYSNLYRRFDCLLLYFLADGYLPPEEMDDTKTIRRYVNTFDKEDMEQTIQQGKEILTLNPFPHEWIGDISNRALSMIPADSEEERYYKWVEWIVKTLEEEARKAGKL